MNLLRSIIHAYLQVPYTFRKITGTGPFGCNKAEYLEGRLKSCGNAMKTALFKHHEKQFNEAACSVASVVSVINAIKRCETPDFTPITQMEILETVKTGHWKERMSGNGYNGRRGLPLLLLGKIVKSSLDAYRINYKSVTICQATKNHKQSETIRQDLLTRLEKFESRGNCIVIAHFDQGALVPTLNIPHISPVGGFDQKTGKVTILDVDTDQEKPYSVPFNTFYKALASNYNHVFSWLGYGSGGCISIDLNSCIRSQG